MCFSLEADAAVGLALLPVGVATLREVRHARELPFASLPLLFAVHQLVEAVVWAGVEGTVSPRTMQLAIVAYLVFALPVLPTLVPLAVLMLEPRAARGRVAPYVGLGVVVSAYLAYAMATGPVTATALPHAITYDADLRLGLVWAALYIVAVIGPSVQSGYPSIVAFGWFNLVGLVVVGLVYLEAFISLWCVYAALTSLLVLLHMMRRRRLTDDDRLRGSPLRSPVGGAVG